MPCIQWKTSAAISAEQEKELREALGEAIALIPGKSESWLMLEFEPERRMAFRGDAQEPAAFVPKLIRYMLEQQLLEDTGGLRYRLKG